MEIIDGTKAKLGATIMLGGFGLRLLIDLLWLLARLFGGSAALGSLSWPLAIFVSLAVAVGLMLLAQGISLPRAA